MSEDALELSMRSAVADTARELITQRLIVNTSGNVSQRQGDFVAITPSGRSYTELEAEDICLLTVRGDIVAGRHLPSSETDLHLGLYRANDDCKAIVHTHSMSATAVSMIAKELPAIHYQMADLGGAIPVAPYATFGSPELVTSVLKTLPGYTAAIMENHGAISFGPNLSKALSRSILLEWCADVWLRARAVGTPTVLSQEQMDDAKAQMAHYANKRDECACDGH